MKNLIRINFCLMLMLILLVGCDGSSVQENEVQHLGVFQVYETDPDNWTLYGADQEYIDWMLANEDCWLRMIYDWFPDEDGVYRANDETEYCDCFLPPDECWIAVKATLSL